MAKVIDYIQQRISFVLRSVTVLLVSAATLAAFAQQGPSSGDGSPSTSVSGYPASLQVKGTVTVNQRPVNDAVGTVLAGDRIETAAAAVARISAPGLSIYVPENSCLKYNGQELELCNCGSVEVNSVRSVSVTFRAGELVVSSEGQNSAFAMSVAGRDLEVVNHRGTAEVTKNGSVLTSVNSGGSHSFAGLGCAAPASHLASTVGTAAALAAPAVLAATVLARSTKRTPISSLNP